MRKCYAVALQPFSRYVTMVVFKKADQKFTCTVKVKGTLMQNWKSHYMFVFMEKQYPENFIFLILRMLELFTREVC